MAGVNWLIYGHCNFDNAQPGLLIENYTYTFADKNNPLNCRIKSVVNPKRTLCITSPHYAIYKSGFAVDENKNEICGELAHVSNGMSCTLINNTNKVRINHYWTKSKMELRIKCARGYPDGAPNPNYDAIMKRLDAPMVEDCSARRFCNQVRLCMEKVDHDENWTLRIDN